MTAAAVVWSNLTVAGAFLVGVTVGGFAVIRLCGYVLAYLRRSGEDVDKPPDRT